MQRIDCPLPQFGLAGQPTPYLPIDQPRHGARPSGVVLAMMTIRLTQALIPTHPTNRVFNRDPALGKRPIELDVFFRSLFAAWFPTRRCAQAVRMRLANPYIRQVANRTDPFGQTREQLRLFQQRQISGRPDRALAHIAYRTLVLVNRHLWLEGMLLLLAAKVRIILFALLAALHLLLERVDDHCQLRCFFE